MLPLAAATLALGLSLLLVGLRGRRINDHPICRRCAFDLIGHETASNASRCPECGSSLSTPHSIRLGSRVRRPMPIVMGTLLLLLGAGGIGAIEWARTTKYDWNMVKPAWLLLRNTQQPTPDDGALKELRARLSSSRLSDAQSRQLLARALTVQADTRAPWSWRWGDIIELARSQGLVTDAQWSDYLSNVRGSLIAAPENPFSRHAGTLYIQPGARVVEGRGGLSTTLHRRYHLERLTVGGVEASIVAEALDNGIFQLGISGGFSLPPIPSPPAHGDTAVELLWTATIFEELPDGSIRQHAQWTERTTGTWDPNTATDYPAPLRRSSPVPDGSTAGWQRALPLTPPQKAQPRQ